ncbi:MAG TPA: condensation domain-containing protein, partial [Terriglobales bacterium]|nr:condensation domain-containing protein [Terriglobales bacterium]
MKMEKQGTAGFWLSPQQKYVWSLQQQGAEMPYRSMCVVSINGPLQPDKLRLALRDVVSHHEMLRTVFQRQPGMKVPFQVILEACEPAWNMVDFSTVDEGQQQTHLTELLRQEESRSFNFEQGPLLHASLLDFGQDHFKLVLSLPTLCCDVQSLSILVRELGER